MRHLAAYLAALAQRDRKQFCIEWNRRLSGWLAEVHKRGRLLRADAEKEVVKERVFAVLEQVNRLLELCGPGVESLVGASTRDILTHECCRTLAIAVAPELYRLRIKL
jgi:hypothetical protein